VLNQEAMHKMGSMKYVRTTNLLPPGSDLKTYDAGRLVFAANDCLAGAGGVTSGKVWVTYDVEFSSPVPPTSIAQGLVSSGGTGVSTSHMFGDNPTYLGNIDLQVGTETLGNSQVIMSGLLIGQEYQITVSINAIATTFIDMPTGGACTIPSYNTHTKGVNAVPSTGVVVVTFVAHATIELAVVTFAATTMTFGTFVVSEVPNTWINEW